MFSLISTIILALFARLSTACLYIHGGTNPFSHDTHLAIYDNDALICRFDGIFHDDFPWMNCINDHYAWLGPGLATYAYAAHGDNFYLPIDYIYDGWSNWAVLDHKDFC
jgi:hypothetical protein